MVGASLALLAACAKPYDPYRVPRKELHSRVHTIALTPLRIGPELLDPDATRREVEALVGEVLERGGFTVVPAEAFEGRWRAIAEAMGGIVDPISGKLDEPRFELIEQHVYRELLDRHGIDALLYLSLVPVAIDLPGAEFEFCGRRAQLYWPGSLARGKTATRAVASCLGAALYDTDEKLLYVMASGLEPIETYHDQRRAARPVEERLRDSELLPRAVREILRLLVEK